MSRTNDPLFAAGVIAAWLVVVGVALVRSGLSSSLLPW
jgi:hypothetical protein